jgi:hypothetical protein
VAYGCSWGALTTWKAFSPVNAAMFDFAPLNPRFLPLPQSAAYAKAARAGGADVFTADLGAGEALVVQRGRVRLLSRGPIWASGVSDREKCRQLRRLARWPGITLATPEEPLAGFGLLPLVTPVSHAIWDLSGDIRAGLAGKWRNRLSAAERAGVRVIQGRAGALERLLAQETAQRTKRRYRSFPATFSRALSEQDLRLWEWSEAGQLQAAMCFVRHGASASYHLGWASYVARGKGVHNVMLWQAAVALKAEGVRWLDLGSLNSEAAPGLFHFKLGTGAAIHRLGPTLLVMPG